MAEHFIVESRHFQSISGPLEQRLCRLTALNRINALACIKSANHGWLGACFSAAEIATTVCFGLENHELVLSKGHAAALQYACLVGLGRLAPERLLTYKDGPDGLQAHTDRGTPGVLLHTGSLGQALSKTAGIAFSQRSRRFVVVLGDGELQEGQCFEAFQTILHRGLDNVVVVIDANGWQTAKRVGSLKGLEPAAALAGLGFEVRDVDGHAPAALVEAIGARGAAPLAVVARTRKDGGSAALSSAGPPGVWHGRVPDDELTVKLIDELVATADVDELSAEWSAAREALVAASATASATPSDEKRGATGEHFGRVLAELAEEQGELVVLDADLAGPCHIAGLEVVLGETRFIEMGISEQDMVSFAGGLALAGRMPVTNTYAAFYKRAVEQIRLNLSEPGARVVYAAHYAGLPYYSDGKTHQSLDDLAIMRCLPGLIVADPVDGRDTAALLRWAVATSERSVYLRLRRASAGLDEEPRLLQAWGGATSPSGEPPTLRGPLVLQPPREGRLLLAVGPQATRLALDAADGAPERGWGVALRSVFGVEPDLDRWRALFAGVRDLVTIEDGTGRGGLRDATATLLQRLGCQQVRQRALTVEGYGPSFRSWRDCAAHHGFTVEGLQTLME